MGLLRRTCRHCGDLMRTQFTAELPNTMSPAKVCPTCDAPDSELTIDNLGGMDKPAPGAAA